MRAALCVAITLLSSFVNAKERQSSGKVSHITLTEAQAARLSAYTPKLQYPLDARAHHMTGRGVFDLHVSLQTGGVNYVEIEHSTGHAVLDTAATNTLKTWRFKPQVLQTLADSDDRKSGQLTVRVPVIYTM
jgi:TonB family protein